jgi:nucleotide-binding universal stress UspA family protein
MIRTILVPLDGSEAGARALPLSCELARGLDARLFLVCVAGPETALDLALTNQDRQGIAEQYSGVTEEDHLLSTDPWMVEHAQEQVRAVAEAERYLAGVAARLAQEGINAEIAVPYGKAVEGILTEIDVCAADFVVVATHAHSRLRRMVGGGVAQELSARSRVPVLLVPCEQP